MVSFQIFVYIEVARFKARARAERILYFFKFSLFAFIRLVRSLSNKVWFLSFFILQIIIWILFKYIMCVYVYARMYVFVCVCVLFLQVSFFELTYIIDIFFSIFFVFLSFTLYFFLNCRGEETERWVLLFLAL